ncbi:SDR family oxidoreductase [Promicromonospora sukumoe]|uniref:3alpha(Or 20beta)-hydroxysteroid dehydrogenase n=1 Tax=Promicromonospora sukumoe TaxID=88382 RepID=A0A7W3J8C6_9MICO|nr:glucose 1-dehydrogenase [Promicromonospora sukumoe]MBA8808162.1 3alpha(or 20beta)-hydroxysteroid dehydrogenase [Promicromonospora sukumoe]
MQRFENKTVIVTGAGGGMGVSHVRAYHAEGADVVIADRDTERGAALAAELGERALHVALDITSEEQWAAAVAATEERFGPVSVLVNNAGMQQAAAPIEHMDADAFRRTLDVNVTGQFLGIRAVTPSMRRGGGGAVVNISSTMGNVGTAYYAAYTASKWAVRGLTKSAALELGRDGIRVNSVHPGVVSTPFINAPVAAGERPIADFYSPAPFAVPRLGEPVELSQLVLFLTSADAAFATGSEFVLDGGLLLGPALQYETSSDSEGARRESEAA